MQITNERLEQFLFDEPTNVYALLDGASIEGLRMHLYDKRPPHYCLFRGELEPDMAENSPYLVGLVRGTPFTDWLLGEPIGNHYGVFAQSRQSIVEMRRHFRELITVYSEDGNPMIFRYYDPRVMHQFLPTCNGGELKSFFGSVDRFLAETESGDAFSVFSLKDGVLKQREIGGEGE